MQDGLHKARTPMDYEKLIAIYYRTLDRVFAEKLAQSGDTIACKPKCSYCCHIKVDGLAIEVFYMVARLRATLGKGTGGIDSCKGEA